MNRMSGAAAAVTDAVHAARDVLFSRGGAAALLNDAYYTQDGYIPVVYRIDF